MNTILHSTALKDVQASTSSVLSASARSCRSLPQLNLTQRTQYPSIKEYTLNHNIKAPVLSGIFLNKGVLGSLGRVWRVSRRINGFRASGLLIRAEASLCL